MTSRPSAPQAEPGTPEGFQHRGAENTRLETFVDAAFAFALTLLVVSFDAVPTNFAELVAALKATPAFLAAFALLMMFWTAHRNWSRRYGLDTTMTTLLSLALVFILLVYVYPLRALMQATFSAITNGWLPSDFRIESLLEARRLFQIYGVGFFLSNLCLVGLYAHAFNLREQLELGEVERYLTRAEMGTWAIVGSMGLLSALLATVVPSALLALAGWCYALLGIVMPLVGRHIARRQAQLATA